MYEEFFGLSGKPFSLLPDADFLYPSKRHSMALTLLDYSIVNQAGFVVITGEVGAGKTTIVRRFLRKAPESLTVGVVTNTSSNFGDLMTWICTAYSLEHKGLDNISLYNNFIEFLLARYAEGKRTLLVVDEAQNLTVDMLESLRMLSNINNEKDLLLGVALVGQPELLAMLQRTELRQFAQRITVHYHLDPLGRAETAAYIRHRLSVVGGQPSLFDDITCAAVHYFTGGVPRLINLLCDMSLVYAYAEELPAVSVDIVAEVVSNRSATGLTSFQPFPDGVEVANLRDYFIHLLHPDQHDVPTRLVI